jgi:nitrate reductase delta subunit
VSYQALGDQLRYPDDPARQELYVQTFEFNPACTLEIGWHLFGENYERGEFLVRMREQLRRHGVPETSELPDHLTHLLALIDRLDQEQAAEFAAQFLLPALGKIQQALAENPYEPLIEAIRTRLESDFPEARLAANVSEAQFPILQEAGIE